MGLKQLALDILIGPKERRDNPHSMFNTAGNILYEWFAGLGKPVEKPMKETRDAARDTLNN
jgi:hypothetical protein